MYRLLLKLFAHRNTIAGLAWKKIAFFRPTIKKARRNKLPRVTAKDTSRKSQLCCRRSELCKGRRLVFCEWFDCKWRQERCWPLIILLFWQHCFSPLLSLRSNNTHIHTSVPACYLCSVALFCFIFICFFFYTEQRKLLGIFTDRVELFSSKDNNYNKHTFHSNHLNKLLYKAMNRQETKAWN